MSGLSCGDGDGDGVNAARLRLSPSPGGRAARRAGSCPPHLQDDPLLEQALLLGRHDEVVSVVLVVDDVFQVDTCPWGRG